MSEKTKGGWTRGPVQTEPGNFIVSESAGIIAEVPCCSGNEADVDFIAAAFNAATALEDQGFDGLEAIKSLPEIVEALRDLLGEGGDEDGNGHCQHCGREFEPEQIHCGSDDCPGFMARTLLARIKEEKL